MCYTSLIVLEIILVSIMMQTRGCSGRVVLALETYKFVAGTEDAQVNVVSLYCMIVCISIYPEFTIHPLSKGNSTNIY